MVVQGNQFEKSLFDFSRKWQTLGLQSCRSPVAQISSPASLPWILDDVFSMRTFVIRQYAGSLSIVMQQLNDFMTNSLTQRSRHTGSGLETLKRGDRKRSLHLFYTRPRKGPTRNSGSSKRNFLALKRLGWFDILTRSASVSAYRTVTHLLRRDA